MVGCVFHGVPGPELPSRYRFDNLKQTILEDYEFEMSEDGIAATASLHVLLSEAIYKAIADKLFVVENHQVVDRNGHKPVWCVQIDACSVHKGMKQTAIAFTLVNGAEKPNSLEATKEFCIFEAGDKYESIKLHAKDTIASINKMHAKGCIELELDRPSESKTEVSLEMIGAGDQAMIHAVNCQGSCRSSWPCAYCETPAGSLYVRNTPKEKDGKPRFRTRTLKRLRLLAHRTTGTCPACKLKLTEDNLAKPGETPSFHDDYKPARGDEGKTFTQVHRGVVYGA